MPIKPSYWNSELSSRGNKLDHVNHWHRHRSIHRSIHWLIDWTMDSLIDWLNHGSIDWLIEPWIRWLIDWTMDPWIDWLNHGFVDWLIDWTMDPWIDWLIDWFIIQLYYSSMFVFFSLFSPIFMETFRASSDIFFSLLLSHSAHEDYVFFANYLNDVKRLLDFHLERHHFRDVLRLLAVQGSPELIYEFSPRLMSPVPSQLVDVWISKSKALNPHRLLPSLQKYDGGPEMASEANQVVRYLEHCVHVLGFTDTALHNYLVTLYCKLRNEDALLAYLLMADEESSRRSIEVRALCRIHQLNTSSSHRLIDLFICDLSSYRSVDWLIDSPIDARLVSIDWLIDWSIDSRLVWSIDWLIDRLIVWFLIDWLIDWLKSIFHVIAVVRPKVSASNLRGGGIESCVGAPLLRPGSAHGCGGVGAAVRPEPGEADCCGFGAGRESEPEAVAAHCAARHPRRPGHFEGHGDFARIGECDQNWGHFTVFPGLCHDWRLQGGDLRLTGGVQSAHWHVKGT